MGYNNFKIGKDGLYMSSKTPQEGYVETRYGTNNEKVTYKKNVPSIEGIVTNFMTKEVTFDGKKLTLVELTLKDGDELNILSCNQYRTNGSNYSEDFQQMISVLNDYEVGQPVKLTATHKKYNDKNGVERKSLVIYLNYKNIQGDNGKNKSTGFISFNDVPRPEAVEKRGSVSYNFDAQMDFYWEKYTNISKKLREYYQQTAKEEDSKPVQNSAPQASAPVQVPSGAVVQPEDDDDLPF